MRAFGEHMQHSMVNLAGALGDSPVFPEDNIGHTNFHITLGVESNSILLNHRSFQTPAVSAGFWVVL